VFCSNSDLGPAFVFYLISNPWNLQSSPCNFKTLYLFNRNSILSDLYAKSFVVTKHIYPLHHIVDNHLFVVLFYLFYSIACFWHVDRQVESEPSENFQDINLEDLDVFCTYFLVSIYRFACW
jgi:hypothetical protein